MRQYLKNTFIYNIFFYLRKNLRIIYSTKSRSRFFWNLNKGDDILSFDYELNKDSTAFVVGAFEGDYLGKLNNRFKCKIYGFEPIDEYFHVLKSKFDKYQNVYLFNFGLSDKTEKVKFSKIGESSSIYVNASNLVEANLKSITEFISDNKLSRIDLLYMNIEGGEYAVLQQLIDDKIIINIKHIQVQYHNIDSNSAHKRKYINKLMSKTHSRKFNYPFIWERWDLKDV